jgi:ribosomal protein L37AE/L43A
MSSPSILIACERGARLGEKHDVAAWRVVVGDSERHRCPRCLQYALVPARTSAGWRIRCIGCGARVAPDAPADDGGTR